MNISPVVPVVGPEAAPVVRPAAEPASPGPTFSDLLRSALAHDAGAQQMADSYAAGRSQNLHETMIAMEKADISLSLLVSVRNKLLDAYREVMRMS